MSSYTTLSKKFSPAKLGEILMLKPGVCDIIGVRTDKELHSQRVVDYLSPQMART